jgi:HEPN domain-containing protein
MFLRQSYGGISEIGKAAGHRLEDAEALLEKRRWRAAMYLAGYAIECKLKAKLMKKYECDNLKELGKLLREKAKIQEPDDIYTHSLHMLLRITDRLDALRSDAKMWKQFAAVNAWLPAWRYTASQSDQDEATDFVEAARDVTRWIENNV